MSRSTTFPLRGGLDIATPVSQLKPGTAWVAINYELAPRGGYRRVAGYERTDGRPSPSATLDLTERAARRAAIQAVPGSGPIRGVFYFKGVTYAFRDTLAGTAKKLYKSTVAGWVEVTTPVLNPGGKGKYIRNNFTGDVADESLYGVDGVNKAFEFDGTTYTEITTGSEPLYPIYIAEFKFHLFLGYPGGSLQNSATGNPLSYVALDGASEIATGDEMTGLINLQGGSLGVFSQDRISILQGSTKDDFVLSQFSRTGAIADSVSPIFSDAIYLDKQIQRLSTTDAFGDYQAGSLSEPIRTLIEDVLGDVQFSYTIPDKNQYALFTNNGTAFLVSFNDNRLSGFTMFQARHIFNVGGCFEDGQGATIVLTGGEDGYVYRMETGTSFDGEMIQSYLQLAPNHIGDFQLRKRYRKITVETDSSAFTGLFVTADFDYATAPRAVQTQLTGIASGLVWNLTNWNEALWNGALKTYAEVYIDGHGRNISVYIYHQSSTDAPFTLELMTIGFDVRKPIR